MDINNLAWCWWYRLIGNFPGSDGSDNNASIRLSVEFRASSNALSKAAA
jgi:hypothetical protein